MMTGNGGLAFLLPIHMKTVVKQRGGAKLGIDATRKLAGKDSKRRGHR